MAGGRQTGGAQSRMKDGHAREQLERLPRSATFPGCAALSKSFQVDSRACEGAQCRCPLPHGHQPRRARPRPDCENVDHLHASRKIANEVAFNTRLGYILPIKAEFPWTRPEG
eukprot:2059547-Pleurochrysis_carterae.AAC.1